MYTLALIQFSFLALSLRFLLWPLLRYYHDSKRLRRFSAPSVAGLTNAWGVWHQYAHTRTEEVHQAHLRFGPVVRVGREHVSFATLEAIRDIYGHGTPMTKDKFYSAFTSTHLNISDAQDKKVHNAKRKRFAAAFTQKNIVLMEDVVRDHLERMVRLLDEKKEVDMKRVMLHFTYSVFSIMFYAQDLGFIENESTITTAETPDGRLYETDMYSSVVVSARPATAAGWAPKSMGMIKFLTQWHSGWSIGDGIRDVTIHLVRNRVKMDTARMSKGEQPLHDLFTTMLFNKEQEALGLELGELVTESTNMFNAAGENTEIALTNIIWLLCRNPGAVAKLREELDTAYDWRTTPIPQYEVVKDLPYLRACIDEGLRLRPSLEGGLPRLVPEGGMRVGGEWLEGGTTVSVSTRTVHRDTAIFHERPEDYIPERWLRDDAAAMQRGFLAFSQGGRGCIGRNIAYFEISLILAVLFSRYDLELPSPDWWLGIDENFSAHTKPLPLKVALRP